MKKYELSHKALKEICNPNTFKFETTAGLDETDLIYGQDRGIAALAFGLSIDSKGYNLFIEGPSGVRKNYVCKEVCF
ncbi:MAG: AAA family ATPase [Oscillospiraceae bacterium]|nr:AAA family ATPase [Oscillospiraceae bacterium]